MFELTTQGSTSTPSTTSVELAAERELGALLRGDSSPAPAESTPAPEPAPQPASATPATADSGAPTTPVAEPTLQPPLVTAPVVEDPVEKKVRDIFGDDPKRAAEAILATNNRAAAMAGKLKELGLDPRTLQPLPMVQPPVQEPPAPTTLDPRAIETETARLLDNDPAFVSLVQTWMQGDSRIKEIASSKSTLTSDMQKIAFAMEIPEIKSDDYKRDQYASQLAQKEQTLLKLQLEEGIIEAKQERLNSAAARFSDRARGVVQQHFQQEVQSRQEEADLAQFQRESYAEYTTTWPLALEKAIADAKIPPELVQDFKEDAKVAALAHLQDTDTAIDNLYSFVGNRAKVMMERLDRFHRMQSATYGAQAAVRTALATGTPPPSSSPPTAVPQPSTPASSPSSLASFERQLEIESAQIAAQMGLWG